MHPHCSFDLPTATHTHPNLIQVSWMGFLPLSESTLTKCPNLFLLDQWQKHGCVKYSLLFSAYLEERRIIIVIIDVTLIQYIILDIKVQPAESGVLMHISDEVAT